MGREHSKARKLHRHVPDKTPQVKTKLSKLSKAQEIFLLDFFANNMGSVVSSPVQKPVQEAPIIEHASKVAKLAKAPKVKETVSIAGLFQRSRNLSREKKQKNSRNRTSDPELVVDFQGGLETAYSVLQAKSKVSFDDIRARFGERLMASRSSDEAFIETVSNAAEKLSTPLLDEQIEIETIKNGKRVKETTSIGKRVTQFKKVIEKEDAKLNDLWKQWDEMQNEYIELGVDVFGARSFGEDFPIEKGREKGFKREMELLELEHSTRVDKLNEEVEGIGAKVLQRMKSSEKELDATMKREQARLLQALIHE